MIESSYNNYLHNSIGISSFYVSFSQKCRILITLSTFYIIFEVNMIREINEIRSLTKFGTNSACDRAKYYDNNKIIWCGW